MSHIAVDCRPDADGWTCDVDLGVTRHQVRVTAGDLARYASGDTDPTDLVRRSFAFLLEREPPSAILRSFDLPVIGRYFPEYEPVITRR